MGKLILNEYNLTNPKLQDPHKIAFFGDVHAEYDKLEKIVDVIKWSGAKIVFLSGDLIESVLGSDYSYEKIKELLWELSKVAIVIFSYGNHDTIYLEAEPEEEWDRLLERNNSFWNSVRDMGNIYVPTMPETGAVVSNLDLTRDIDVSTFSMPASYFWFKEQKEEYDEYVKALDKIKICTDKFNILLAHSPKNLIQGNSIDEYLKLVKNYNLILSGHMHGALLPNYFRNSSRRGLIGPGKKIFPKNAYGIVEDDGVISLNTGGVAKVSEARVETLNVIPGLKRLVTSIYPPELEIINAEPGVDSSIRKVKELKI